MQAIFAASKLENNMQTHQSRDAYSESEKHDDDNADDYDEDDHEDIPTYETSNANDNMIEISTNKCI